MPRRIESEAGRVRSREYGRWYYRHNVEKEKARLAANKLKTRQWFAEYKSALQCQVCGEAHPAALDFHHRDSNEKDISVAQAIHNGWGSKRVLQELEKCDVLCANCHRRLHQNKIS